MRLNKAQRVVLAIGLFGVVGVSLYPPWSVYCAAYEVAGTEVKYAFLLDPPTGWMGRESCSTSIDVVALLVVFAVVLGITFGLVLLLGIRPSEESKDASEEDEE